MLAHDINAHLHPTDHFYTDDMMKKKQWKKLFEIER